MTSTEKSLPELVAEVSAKLQRIEKKGTAPAAMGSFPFVRSVDVMDALKPELDARGILLRPEYHVVGEPMIRPRGESGYTMVLTVGLALWATRKGDELLLARTIGMGADTQDKASGKAQTSALKEAILKAFAIPTGDDPEAEHIDQQRRRSQSSQQRRSDAPASAQGSSSPKAQQVAKINELLKRVDGLESQTVNRFSVRAHVRRELSLDSIGEVIAKGDDAARAHLISYLEAKLASPGEAESNGRAESMSEEDALRAGARLAGKDVSDD